MGNISSIGGEGFLHGSDDGSRAAKWVMAKRCVGLLEVSFPEAKLDTVLLLPRDVLIGHGHLPTFKEVKANLRPILSVTDKRNPPGKTVYLSYLVGGNTERRWAPGPPAAVDMAAAKAAAAAANAAGGAVAVAVAAAAAGAAQAAAGAAIAARASAAGEAADLYATAKAFLLENPEFQYVWVASACMPPHLREDRWLGAVPGVNGSNMFDHLHPGALLACDALLVAPPERESMAWLPEERERYTDLEVYSMSPWKALEGTVAQLVGIVTYYAFRLGDTLIFTGPFGHQPADLASPVPRGYQNARLFSSPIRGGAGGGGSSVGSDTDDGGFSTGTPVSRAKAVASGAARALLSRGWATGNKWSKEPDRGVGGGGALGAGGTGVGAPSDLGMYGSGNTAPASESSSHAGRRWGDSGAEGSRLERAVSEALDRFGTSGSGTPPERNWRGVVRPCYLLRKAREDVQKFSDARGALKQAMCSMSVTREQAEEFFGVWRHLGVMGSVKMEDRLAALNMLLFTVALADGHYCPKRPREYVGRVVDESLVGGGHLDLWMKDLSPDDCRDILKAVNLTGKKLAKLTIGSSHTAGAGVGTFLKGHATLKELEVEWEGVRDLASISQGLADHKSLVRLNLTHNEIGPRGAAQLAKALRRNRSLTEIDLRENQLGPMGMKAIANALAYNDSIRTLHLQDNAIGDDGVIDMTEALMRNGRLTTVCLDGNQVSDVGAKVICIAIKTNLALKLLSLSRNALPDEAKRALYDAWSQREVEGSLDQSGMFLDQAATGTAAGRGRWQNGIPLGHGVLTSTSGVGLEGGGGVLVSPTRDERAGNGNVRNGGNGNSTGRSGGGSGGLLPKFSPVSDSFGRKPLYWTPK